MELPDAFLDTLYGAPASPALWAEILDACIKMVGADSGWVNELDCRDRFAGSGFVCGVDAKEQDRYFAYYASLDPFRVDAQAPACPVGMWSDERFIRKQRLVRSEFYSDFMAPIDVHSILIIRMYDDGNVTRSMHLNYDRGACWSTSRGWQALQSAFPHLRRAAALSSELRRVKTANAAIGDALDVTTGGVVFLDHRGEVCFATGEGTMLLRRGDCLSLKRGRLLRAAAAATPAVHGEFERLVRLATAGTKGFRAGGSMALTTVDGARTMVMTITPLHAGSRRNGEPTAMVTLRRLDAAQEAPRTLRTFGLTPREETIALLLSGGASPRDIAEALGISYNTIRNYLKSIYNKLEVRRQGELIAKLSRQSIRTS